MPATNTSSSHRFVRRTTLTAAERRMNFHQIDHDVVATVCSDEAAKVTDKMSKIYLRLVSAPRHFWQSEGVLCFEGEGREDEWHTGYEQLIELLGVSSATAAKALAWMSEQGVIGYSSPKNGHATRIWLNRAASSISTSQQRKDNLRLVGATVKSAEANSFFGAPALKNEPAFKEVFIQDTFEINLYPGAPEHAPDTTSPPQPERPTIVESRPVPTHVPSNPLPPLSEGTRIAQQIEQLAADVEKLQLAIAQPPSAGSILAAVSAAVRAEINDQLEHQFNLTRSWLRDKALPQVSRISQGETFKLLRAAGLVKSKAEEKAAAYVGASTPRPASYQGGDSDSPKAANDDLLAAAEAVWLIADLQKLDLETCLREVIAEKGRGQGEKLATQYEQKLRETVYGTEVHDHIREKLEWWSPDMSRCRSGASLRSDKDDPREKQNESECPSSSTNLSALSNPAGDNFQKTEAIRAPLPTARAAP